MNYTKVDALGPCLKNADYCELFPLCCKGPWHGSRSNSLLYSPWLTGWVATGSYTARYVEKECLIHYYKLVLALENTITYNYTTEKFFQPLKMGTASSPSSLVMKEDS